MPNKNDPLTVAEVQEATDEFFPLFDIVNAAMQRRNGSVEDTLKVMESIAKLGHKRRADKADEEKKLKFGFNKSKDEENADT